MKRFFISFLAVLCIPFCACHAVPAVPDLAGDFTAELSFALDGREYAASYTRSGATKTVVFTAPEALCGMTALQAADGTCTVTVGDLTYGAKAAEHMLAFTRLLAPPAGVLRYESAQDGVYCFAGRDGADAYTVYTDQSGLLLRVCGRVEGREYEIQILRMERE